MKLNDLEDFVDLETSSQSAGKTNPSRAGVTPTGEFGGYNSWEEFAVKDPKNAEKAIADSTPSFIKLDNRTTYS